MTDAVSPRDLVASALRRERGLSLLEVYTRGREHEDLYLLAEALIDWDESHVDVPDLDLVLPHNAAGLDDGAHNNAAQAWAAWEAAVCWDDEHSVKRLAEVRAI